MAQDYRIWQKITLIQAFAELSTDSEKLWITASRSSEPSSYQTLLGQSYQKNLAGVSPDPRNAIVGLAVMGLCTMATPHVVSG